MATGPTTLINDVVVPEIFTPYVQQLTEEKTAVIDSGIMARSALLDNALAGGGLTFNVPSFQDLDSDVERISTDTSNVFNGGNPNDPTPFKIETSQEIAVRLSRNASWSSMDLTAQLAGDDPMDAIANRVGNYWRRRLQAAFIATMNGVIADNTANDSGDYTVDVTGNAGAAAQFSAEAFIDACQTAGDSMEDFTLMMVHSAIMAKMKKLNLIEFIPDSEGRTFFQTYQGHRVVVDDGLPTSGSGASTEYDTWIFGPGAVQFGMGTPQNATAVERREGGGNGSGQDVLYNRVSWCIHPVGHAWVGTAPNGGPANTGTAGDDLDEAGSWNRVYPERKQIKFARLVTLGG